MKVGVLALLLLTPFVSGQSSPSSIIPFHRIERAYILLSAWYAEEDQEDPWPEVILPQNRSVVGHNCSVTPGDTLHFMYWLRIYYTLKDHKKSRFYRIVTHIARHLNFYEKKWGITVLISHSEFCQNPSNHFQLPDGTTGFAWPPDPHPLVCESGKCVPCGQAVAPENKEACNLLHPSEETFEPPTEAQLLYEHLKTLTRSVLAYTHPRIRVEGLPCSAAPLKTLAYITLRKDISSTLEDPEDLESFKKQLGQLYKIQNNLEYYKHMFQNFSEENDLNVKSVYCDYQPSERDFRQGRPDAHGGLVCGGMTCKPCKIRPLGKNELQEWNFEQGPLFEACKLITSLEVGLPGTCLPKRPAEPCERCKGVGIPENWLSRWQATADADSGCNNLHRVSEAICLVIVPFFFGLMLPN